MISFEPMSAATVNITTSTSSARIQIENFAAGGDQVRVMNNTNGTAWIEFGDATVTATTASSIPLPSGAVEVFSVPAAAANVLYGAAIISGTTTGQVYFTPGAGI